MLSIVSVTRSQAKASSSDHDGPWYKTAALPWTFDKMTDTMLPPFPADVPVHSLLIVDYALIKSGDEEEIDKLWKAATDLGFW
jgi:hypothetical protein